MKKIKTLLLIAAMSSSAVALGADAISAADFAKKAGAAGAAEVEMGKLGAQKATNAEVKAFAQRMVTDHTKANKELMAAAKTKGLEVPTDPDLMHKGMAEKFEHQSADQDFNHDFMQQMVRDHKATVELFQTAANDTTLDPEMRALAKKTLPTLQEHLSDAQKLEAKLAKK
jgi:putative membrane protein